MAEPEELLSDAARHATVFVQDLWRKYRPPEERSGACLTDLLRRLDLFLSAVFQEPYKIRPAQPPAPPSLLRIIMRNDRRPRLQQAIPGTDGRNIWLPRELDIDDDPLAVQLYRAMAVSQAQRAKRGSARLLVGLRPLERDVYLVLEALAAERDLVENLPGLGPALAQLRHWALSQRPSITTFSVARRPLEGFVRGLLSKEEPSLGLGADPAHSLRQARWLIEELQLLPPGVGEKQLGPNPLLRDFWTGDLHVPGDGDLKGTDSTASLDAPGDSDDADSPVRSSRLRRRPEQREADAEDEDDQDDDAPWMVQTDDPHPHAEDPMGLQRPTDRDEEDSADQYADLVSDLPEARLVTSPGRPKEVLLSDDPPDTQHVAPPRRDVAGQHIPYPEWDYRSQSYAYSASVRILPPQLGPQQWVDDTLAAHAGKLAMIRRRFQLLRAQPQWLKRRPDGDEIDLEAYIESYSDFRAGASLAPNLYQVRHRSRLSLAISLVIDISGSTDGWIGEGRRVIDVEREALLLVCIALESLGETWSVQAFSGEGRQGVTVRSIKGFGESYSGEVARRISALEPEHYTRVGAALRHASSDLMKQPAGHRLLLLLSDGKPNDNDLYEGQYGVEDTRQAINEARLQGVHPFCLTIDQRGSDYLPRMFGQQQYALLSRPDNLPQVLLDWLKRLITTA